MAAPLLDRLKPKEFGKLSQTEQTTVIHRWLRTHPEVRRAIIERALRSGDYKPCRDCWGDLDEPGGHACPGQ